MEVLHQEMHTLGKLSSSKLFEEVFGGKRLRSRKGAY